jgi:hypothetical protein
MRFLADENFPAATARALAGLGYDIVSVMTTTPGASDLDVLARAERERRVLLTFDKDFGDLARSFNLSGDCGVVLFRIPMPLPGDAGDAIAALVAERDDWTGHFSVIEPGRLRMRKLG